MKQLMVFLAVLVFAIGSGAAAQESVTATSEYKMGDNETKATAKNLSFARARSQALDLAAKKIAGQAGGPVQPFVPALVDVQKVGEQIAVEGDDIIFSTTVQATWNPATMAPALKQIQQDPALQAKIKTEEAALARDLSRPVRREVAKDQLMKLRAGMGYGQMVDAVGEPRSTLRCKKRTFYEYGPLWVCFSDGIIKGYILSQDWKGPCSEYQSYGGEIKYF